MHDSTFRTRREGYEKTLSWNILFLRVCYSTAITTYAIYVSVNEYLNSGKVVIGEVLVDTEFPVKGLSKLVTYLMIVLVVGCMV